MSDVPVLEKPAKGYEFYFGLGFFILLLVLIVVGVVKLRAWLANEQQAPVQEVVVSGQRDFIKDSEIESLIKKTQPGSFFELDVEQTHKSIEALPWVYRASVRKRWPTGLEVYIVEQQPAAIWNEDMLLNQFGEAFNAQITDPAALERLQLPKLFGPGGGEKTALQGYKDMQSLLETSELRIVEMFLSERFAWHAQLNNGVKLNLGRSEFINRLQRFVDLLPLISQQQKLVDYVDLRYDTGLAVGWKADDSDLP